MRVDRTGLAALVFAAAVWAAAPTAWAQAESAGGAPPAAAAPEAAPASQPDEQSIPPQARRYVEVIREMGQVQPPDPRDMAELASFRFGLEQAVAALKLLARDWPAVAAREDIRQAELGILFNQVQFDPDEAMGPLRLAVDRVLSDAAAPRGLAASAGYFKLKADLIERSLRAQSEATTQPDAGEPANWLVPQLERWTAFGEANKDQPAGQQAFAEATILTEQLLGYQKAAPLLERFIAVFPKDRAAQARLLAQVAVDQLHSPEGGWKQAEPLADRLLKDYAAEEITPGALGYMAALRHRADPAGGRAMLADLGKRFAGNEQIAIVWAALAIEAYQQQDQKLTQERLGELASRFPKSEARRTVLAQLALAEFERGGMPTAGPFITLLEQQFPDSEQLKGVLLQLADTQLAEAGYAKARPFIDRVIGKYPDAPEAASFKGVVRRHEAVGKPFAMSFVSMNGKPVDVAKLRGQVVVVYFWATWSVACIRELDQAVALADRYKDRAVFVGVSLDSDGELVRQTVEDNRLPWANANFCDGKGRENRLAVEWGVRSIPHFLLIDRGGKLVSPGATDGGELAALLEKFAAPAAEATPPQQ